MRHVNRISRDAAVWVIKNLCHLHRIPFDTRLLLQQHPPGKNGFLTADLLLAIDEIGFTREEMANQDKRDFATRTFPCLFFIEEVALEPEGSKEPVREAMTWLVPALITAVNDDTVTYYVPSDPAAQTCFPSELASLSDGEVISFRPPREALKDVDGTEVKQQKTFGFAWFVPEILKYKKVWRHILAASLALQLVGLVTPLFTQVVIDKVVVHQAGSTLIAVGVGMALSIIFSGIFTWVRQYLVLHTGNRVDAVLGSRVFAHLLKLPMAYFAHRPTGTLVARLHGVETIREFLSGAATTLILDLPFMTVLLAVMFWYSWQLSLVSLAFLLLLTGMSFAVTPVFRQRLNQQFLLGARSQAFVTEYLAGMDTVKALQLEPRLEKRYGVYLADYLAAGFSTKQVANGYNTVANGLDQLQTLIVLIVGALLVMNNNGFTIGMLVAFQMFSGRLSQPVLRLVGLYQEFQQASLSVARLGDLMNAPAEPYTLIPARTSFGPGVIELSGISFRYTEERPWLYRDLSYKFKPGCTTLIAGPSGSGKSTLAKLLLGFYRPAEGAILIDGQDIRHFSANELRAKFGVVPQETVLFSGTLYDNLQMANPLANFQQIVQACQMAEIHDAIEKLPQGYQTEIGEHGVGLSGGQKQRIAIARALLKRPQILIFDEATSNLDPQTAEHFAKTINRLKGKVTILFIAHQIPKGLQIDESVIIGVTQSENSASPNRMENSRV